jgi:predicted CXXCH cytochrome family protein
MTAPQLAYPAPDLACRTCHGDKTDELTLTPGETIPLGVDLAMLDASPHSSQSATGAVACNDCHLNENRYRYPHLENPAQTGHEFALAVSNNCQSCHYPHLPFHSTQQTEYMPPACVDCHGSHGIDRVENIANSMPANCVQCHTDQTTDWATDLIAPRPGFGTGAEGYIGSARCNGCHEDKYGTWQHTLHAKLVQNPTQDPSAVVGDFMQADPALTFGLTDVAYTLGSRWSQLYLTQTVSNTFTILPAQWIVATGEWKPYHPEDWSTRDWRQECGSCHTTGLETQNWTFTEFGVGCESCHGPGRAHAADPENVKPFADIDDQVCGACHSRGQSPDGHPFPATYRPGDSLADHFSFATSEDAVWPDGSAKLHEQQYMDWILGNKMADSGKINCTTCHAVHDTGAATGQIVKPVNELCLDCHAQQGALIQHTPFHEAAMQKQEFFCTDCHMPKLATNATPFDMHNHSFLQPNPQASVDHGGVANMPNACNQCHQGSGETAEWAAQTISFAQAQVTPVAGAFYGPGPTPTSPPPPTPISSVGPPEEYNKLENGVWIRRSVIITIWAGAILFVAWAYYRFRTRRAKNA